MRLLFNHFLRGLLVLFPLTATIWIFFAAVAWLNDVFAPIIITSIGIDLPGLGILLAFIFITATGLTLKLAFTKPLIAWFERVILKMPLVSIIYSSLKDLTEAFVGDKKKFTLPVVVNFPEIGAKRLGFITEENLDILGLNGEIAVYCPHSYNFSGNLYIVSKERVQILNIDSSELMKFTVSGGVSDLTIHKKSKKNNKRNP